MDICTLPVAAVMSALMVVYLPVRRHRRRVRRRRSPLLPYSKSGTFKPPPVKPSDWEILPSQVCCAAQCCSFHAPVPAGLMLALASLPPCLLPPHVPCLSSLPSLPPCPPASSKQIVITKLGDGSDWELGRGSYGRVYRAVKDEVQVVAVKTIAAADAARRELFVREIALMKYVSRDPNIVQVRRAEGRRPAKNCSLYTPAKALASTGAICDRRPRLLSLSSTARACPGQK